MNDNESVIAMASAIEGMTKAIIMAVDHHTDRSSPDALVVAGGLGWAIGMIAGATSDPVGFIDKISDVARMVSDRNSRVETQ